MYQAISECRLCGNRTLVPILDLGLQCLTGVFPKSREQVITSAPLQLVKCETGAGGKACGLVQLRHSCDPWSMYGEGYGYRSGLNQSMVNHLRGKVEFVLDWVQPGRGDVVIDIGSNDGTLLGCYPANGVELVGIDPSAKRFKQYYPEAAQLVPDFFSADVARDVLGNKKAKVITSIAMFYDLESPEAFVRDIEKVLADDGVWLFEQSYLPQMLATNSYDTVCHEHLEYYSMRQIKWILDRVGMKVLDVDFNAANGGSFAVLSGKRCNPIPEAEGLLRQIAAKEDLVGIDSLHVYQGFENFVGRHKESVREFFDYAKQQGLLVAGYGASTKGNVLLQHCDVTPDDLYCIAEVNEDKYGRFTPGSLIPIVPEERVRQEMPECLMVLPWHFREHIIAREKDYLSRGGQLLFPLPEMDVVRRASPRRQLLHEVVSNGGYSTHKSRAASAD